jgi:hypothetical protein
MSLCWTERSLEFPINLGKWWGFIVKINRIIRICLLVLITFCIPNQQAFADGPGTGGRRIRLDEEPAGPYLLRVVTSPTPPRVENLYIEVRVTEVESRRILSDLIVTVTALSTDGEVTRVVAIATHDTAPIPDDYAAHMLIPRAGVWNIVVHVDGALGAGEASFLERVSSLNSLGPIISLGAPFGGLAILIIIFLRLQRRSGEETER